MKTPGGKHPIPYTEEKPRVEKSFWWGQQGVQYLTGPFRGKPGSVCSTAFRQEGNRNYKHLLRGWKGCLLCLTGKWGSLSDWCDSWNPLQTFISFACLQFLTSDCIAQLLHQMYSCCQNHWQHDNIRPNGVNFAWGWKKNTKNPFQKIMSDY